MHSQSNLEIKGTLSTHALAELLVEIFAVTLSGALRLSHENHKTVVYFNAGKPVFAVSNARRHRLFELLLRNNQITQDQLAGINNFINDIELGETLKARSMFSETEMNEIFSRQIEEILQTALDWKDGEWMFSPFARARETIQFKVDLQELLLEHARDLPGSIVAKRFKSFNETFGANPSADMTNLKLMPKEAFVLSRFEKSFLKIEDVKVLSALSDVETLQVLYTLWLGGFLFRQNWNRAFTERQVSAINSARLSLKKEEQPAVATVGAETNVPKERVKPVPAAAPSGKAPPVSNTQPEIVEQAPKLSLEDYLTRTENSENYYVLLDVAPDAHLSDIKRSYFALAKRFHPDRYHQEKNSELQQRVQKAFAQLAQAYETLKGEETRQAYDFRLGRNLANPKSREKSAPGAQIELAKEYFEQGFTLLMDEEYEEALPLLARASQMSPQNARYHAFYGKVLSSDETQRHKAESEMQTAIKLEPQNATFRLIMAEFYIQFGLYRRSEGELQKLLAMYPGNKEARALLDSLPNK